ncbi:MAG: hypothetical protein JNM79_08910 [Burkholderiales bacterium]|nr:hypothetical protein [Burkholderiales bacterium]
MRLPAGFARTLVLALAAVLAPCAAAFDEGDAGIYTVIDQKNQATDVTFRFYARAGQWIAEERQPDGSWRAMPCSGDCVLKASTPEQLARIFGKSLERVTPTCLQNAAFGVCRYELKSSGEAGYVYLVLTGPEAVLVRLELAARL